MKIVEFLKTASVKTWLIFLVAAGLLFGAMSIVAGSGSDSGSGSGFGFGSGLGGKDVAKPIDLDEFEKLPTYPVQDLRTWGQGEVRLSDEPVNMSGYHLYKYRISQEVL